MDINIKKINNKIYLLKLVTQIKRLIDKKNFSFHFLILSNSIQFRRSFSYLVLEIYHPESNASLGILNLNINCFKRREMI